jgi:Pyruvate/2-oxoacid:ferredoxin oxidoreductase gamma subunit/ribosomal protein S18 acetylase RimI-like enzyme
MSIEIRRMNDDDVGRVHELFCRVLEGLKKQISMEDRASLAEIYSEQNLRICLSRPRRIHLIACDGDDIVGFSFAWASGGIGNIRWLGVDPERRGEGIGAQLVERTLNEFAEKYCYSARLFVYSTLRGSIALFEKFGFERKSEIDEDFLTERVLYYVKRLREPTPEERQRRIVITGTAGQGIKLMAHCLGRILALLGKEVSVNVLYGPSVRAGQIEAEIVYSDEKIEVPVVDKAHVWVLLSSGINPKDRRADRVIVEESVAGPAFLSDTDQEAEKEKRAFEKISLKEFGSPLFINMIALGRLLQVMGLSIDKLNLSPALPAAHLAENIEAIKYGYTFLDF